MKNLLWLLLINLILWLILGGYLAWETHLGGFIAGWFAAQILEHFSRREYAQR